MCLPDGPGQALSWREGSAVDHSVGQRGDAAQPALENSSLSPSGTLCSLQGAPMSLSPQGSSWAVSERAQEEVMNMGTGVEGSKP